MSLDLARTETDRHYLTIKSQPSPGRSQTNIQIKYLEKSPFTTRKIFYDKCDNNKLLCRRLQSFKN